MARNKWHEALARALEKDDAAVMQLATIDAAGRPRVRSLIHRAFLTAAAHPTLPLILSTTDVRTPKVTQLATTDGVVEVVYWTPSTQAQFRILGRAWVVPREGYVGTNAARTVIPSGVVYDALEREGFDWEHTRVTTFDRMSGRLKASWCRPVSGTPLDAEAEAAMREWPEWLPELADAPSLDSDGAGTKLLERALENFALLVIEPFEVDYLELGVRPERRTRFERGEGGVEFRETLVVP